MHLDDEQVERVRHGELPRELEKSIREHLAGCSECRSRVAEGQRDEDWVYSMLRVLDHPPGRIDANAVVARAGGTGLGRWRWAAALLVAVSVGSAAFAMPGSPVRGWVREALEWIAPRGNSPSPIPTQSPRQPAVAGVGVVPGRALLILFTSPQSSGEARVSLTDGSEVVVRTQSGAATFTSDPGRLVIDNRSSTAMFEIQIPRVAPRVEIRVNGVRVYLKDGDRARAGNVTVAGDVYVLRLSLPRS
ncbi:MAG TPA: zf-HC2 domain-containing protein [Gemmatimonadaceae bacterium]|nr:zf-HC2 domain-containing protein [Gemmatimonadaceae bacterium]